MTAQGGHNSSSSCLYAKNFSLQIQHQEQFIIIIIISLTTRASNIVCLVIFGDREYLSEMYKLTCRKKMQPLRNTTFRIKRLWSCILFSRFSSITFSSPETLSILLVTWSAKRRALIKLRTSGNAYVTFPNTSAYAQKLILIEGREVESVFFKVDRSDFKEVLTDRAFHFAEIRWLKVEKRTEIRLEGRRHLQNDCNWVCLNI